MFEVIKVEGGMLTIKCSLETLSLLKRAVLGESTLLGPTGIMYMILASALRNAEMMGILSEQTGYHLEGEV